MTLDATPTKASPSICVSSLVSMYRHGPTNLLRNYTLTRCHPIRCTRHIGALAPTDDTAIPLKPTWSINKLLESYPKPSLSPETIARLHKLSALVPPVEGTPEHARLTRELNDLVNLDPDSHGSAMQTWRLSPDTAKPHSRVLHIA